MLRYWNLPLDFPHKGFHLTRRADGLKAGFSGHTINAYVHEHLLRLSVLIMGPEHSRVVGKFERAQPDGIDFNFLMEALQGGFEVSNRHEHVLKRESEY